MELIYGDIGTQNDWWLYVKAMNGTDKPGWPKNLSASDFAQALLDSDDDGRLEIVSTSSGLHMNDSSGTEIWYLPYDGPIFQSWYNPNGISIDDLDNDGNQEIVVGCISGGALFVFDAQGNVRPGWPAILPVQPGYMPPAMYNSASIGDIDNDGLKEMLVGVTEGGAATYPNHVYCFKSDGSYCPGFPVGVSRPGYRSKAVLIDVDGDGQLETAIGKEAFEFNVYRGDGSLYPGYPIAQGVRGFAVGDPDRDQSFDMVYSKITLRGFNLATASALPSFPFTDPSEQFGFEDMNPANICDLSPDAGLEIASGAYSGGFVRNGKLFAFNLNGQLLAGYPSALLFHRALTTGCTVNDVDGSGTTDICCGSHNEEAGAPKTSTVYCWDSGYPYNLDNVDWAMDGFDLGHTGRWRRLYHINKISSQLSAVGCQPANPCYLPSDGSLIAVDVTAVREHGGANPAGQDVRYSRTIGCGNYEGPVIDHGDGTYTRMLRAPTADCTTDIHAWVNEFKLQDCQQIVFTNSCFQPPDAFSLISPANGAFNQPPTVTLTWPAVGSFPNQATSYDLYFGAFTNPPLKIAGLTTTQYTVSVLAPNARYCWKVVARNACGVTPSPMWCFTTASCTAAPQSFNNLSPANGATGVPLPVNLTWTAASGATQYDVYLGPDPASLTLMATVYKPQATLTGLSFRKTYYWRIIAKNPCGPTPGPLWAFATRLPFPKPVPSGLGR
jgi:hypothetical protein